MSALPSPLPVVVGRLTKNRREAVVVALKEFEGVRLIDLRIHAATPESLSGNIMRDCRAFAA